MMTAFQHIDDTDDNLNVSGARPSHERVFGKKEAHEVVDRQTQLICACG